MSVDHNARNVALSRLVRSITGDTTTRKESPFLAVLPPEIRRHIYHYLLPGTVPLRDLLSGGVAHVWVRGNISIMATCQQIHEETAKMLYGNSVFIVEVGYDSILMRYRRLLESGLVPEATPPFLEVLWPVSLRRIKQVAISIKHVDSYTGMIKHNCGGPGLTDGLRESVQKLVDALQQSEQLHVVRVHLDDRNRNVERAQTVLEPFANLKNFVDNGGLMLTGDVTAEYAKGLLARAAA